MQFIPRESLPTKEIVTETPQLFCAHALPLATASHPSKLQTAAERRREYRIAAPTWLWNMLHRWRFPAVWAAEAGERTTVASAPEHPSHAGLASARKVAPYTDTKLRMFPQFRCTCALVTSLPGEHHRLQVVKERAHDPMQNSALPPRPYKGGFAEVRAYMLIKKTGSHPLGWLPALECSRRHRTTRSGAVSTPPLVRSRRM
jgi:hypothetical protein